MDSVCFCGSKHSSKHAWQNWFTLHNVYPQQGVGNTEHRLYVYVSIPRSFVFEHLVVFSPQLFSDVFDVLLTAFNFRHLPLFYWNSANILPATSYVQHRPPTSADHTTDHRLITWQHSSSKAAVNSQQLPRHSSKHPNCWTLAVPATDKSTLFSVSTFPSPQTPPTPMTTPSSTHIPSYLFHSLPLAGFWTDRRAELSRIIG